MVSILLAKSLLRAKDFFSFSAGTVSVKLRSAASERWTSVVKTDPVSIFQVEKLQQTRDQVTVEFSG